MENEKSKSIWKKPLKGRRLVAGLVLLLVVIFFLIFSMGTVPSPLEHYLGLPTYALFLSICLVLLGFIIVKFTCWLCCWRNFKRFFFGLACLITLIALFYAEENWRSKHAWEKFKREQEAKGERLTIAGIAPPAVPDDQNFAMTPIWVEHISTTMGAEKAKVWYGERVAALGHTNFVARLEMPVELYGLRGLEFTNSISDWQKAETFDLKIWQAYYRKLAAVTNFFPTASQPQRPAADVLLALTRYDSTIEELRKASELPYARFPISYNDDEPAAILLPHLAWLKGCARALQLRAVAELQSGQTDKALADIKLMLRLTDSLRDEPTFISQLVGVAMGNITIQPIWEGLSEHQWSEAQLIALDSELARFDFLSGFGVAMRGERALDVGEIDYLRRSRRIWSLGDMNSEFNTDDNNLTAAIYRFAPAGWFYKTQLEISRFYARWYLPLADTERRVVSPESARQADAAVSLELTRKNLSTRLERTMLPALGNSVRRFAYAQTSVDLAHVACALERYRLAHGKFPETLAALSPQFMEKIPHDIIGGQPLKYHLTADGQFVLYSVGWNEKDDDGAFMKTTNKGQSQADWRGSDRGTSEEGDWVWRYPAK
jgi:hypothetical protein